MESSVSMPTTQKKSLIFTHTNTKRRKGNWPWISMNSKRWWKRPINVLFITTDKKPSCCYKMCEIVDFLTWIYVWYTHMYLKICNNKVPCFECCTLYSMACCCCTCGFSLCIFTCYLSTCIVPYIAKRQDPKVKTESINKAFNEGLVNRNPAVFTGGSCSLATGTDSINRV